MNTKNDNEIKIITIGEFGVGKSSIIRRFIDNKFMSIEISNMGAKYFIKNLEYDNKQYGIKVFDTEGEEIKGLTPNYYNKAKGVLLVFDLTNKNSLNAIKKWHKDLEGNIGKDNIVKYLIGNKNDKDKKISNDEIKSLGLTDLKYFEISCKIDDNKINEIFKELLVDIIKKESGKEDDVVSLHYEENRVDRSIKQAPQAVEIEEKSFFKRICPCC
jgi:small GTP-binding protein